MATAPHGRRPAGAESGLDQPVIDAIIDAALPTPVLQHWVQAAAGSYRLDLADVLAILRRHLVDP